jgi:hypothetical protein
MAPVFRQLIAAGIRPFLSMNSFVRQSCLERGHVPAGPDQVVKAKPMDIALSLITHSMIYLSAPYIYSSLLRPLNDFLFTDIQCGRAPSGRD